VLVGFGLERGCGEILHCVQNDKGTSNDKGASNDKAASSDKGTSSDKGFRDIKICTLTICHSDRARNCHPDRA
jgi:hypothetical protein